MFRLIRIKLSDRATMEEELNKAINEVNGIPLSMTYVGDGEVLIMLTELAMIQGV